MMKIRLTPDQFFPEFKKVCYVQRLAPLADMDYYVMTQRIRHDVSRRSVARFSEKHMPKLNDALQEMAEIVAGLQLDYKQYLMDGGSLKDGRAVVPQFGDIGHWVRIKSIVKDALGWNTTRYRNIVDDDYSKIYGHITADDCERINVALKKVAAFLGSVELYVEPLTVL